MVFRKIFGKAPGPAPSVEPGDRVYAIGDVHGRADCLEALLAMIAADHTARPPARLRLVILGDLVDRGPDSRGVVERVMHLDRDFCPTTVLMGNHEELLLRAVDGERDALTVFNRVGGRETLLSYGVSADAYDHCALADLAALAQRAVPADHLAFLAGLDNWVVSGGYVFVHAGVRPGVALADQDTADLRWIREPFLSHRGSYGSMVVHGHTITEQPDVQANRIGIDTGAYATGVLTAIGLDGEDRWFLQTG